MNIPAREVQLTDRGLGTIIKRKDRQTGYICVYIHKGVAWQAPRVPKEAKTQGMAALSTGSSLEVTFLRKGWGGRSQWALSCIPQPAGLASWPLGQSQEAKAA